MKKIVYSSFRLLSSVLSQSSLVWGQEGEKLKTLDFALSSPYPRCSSCSLRRSWSLSAMRAMNSELVGFPFTPDTV